MILQRDADVNRRERPAPNGDAVAALQSSQAARGLLRDVITGLPDQSPAGPGLDEGVAHTRARETDRPDSPPRVPTSRSVTSEGERVDELVRRVKEGASAASAEAIASGAHSRPKGTADLAADAAVKGSHRQLPNTGSPRSLLAKRPRSRWWGAAAVGLAAGLAVIVLAVDSSGSRLEGRTAAFTAARSGQAEAGTKIFGGAVRTTIVGIDHAIKARAVLANAQARPAHRQQVGHRQRTQSQRRSGATRKHPSTTGQGRSTSQPSPGIAATSDTHSSAPRLATASEAHSNTPPATGVSTSESTTSHNSSTTATSHPAGPTGSNPLGGIGSCVKGC